MKILIIENKSFGLEDLKSVLKLMGYTYTLIKFSDATNTDCKKFTDEFEKITEATKYDCVFSFNFFPVVSNNCNKINLPYISLIYDSPQIKTFSYTIINPCNHVFVFDSADYFRFHDQGIKTIEYMPLPVNVHRLDKQLGEYSKPKAESPDNTTNPNYSSDISFIGSLYNEKHNLYDRLVNSGIKNYTKGYLDAVMDIQNNIYGAYYLEDLLNGDVLDDMMNKMEITTNPDGVETPAYVYANYFLCRKMATTQRLQILNALNFSLASKYKVNLYTHNPPNNLGNINCFHAIDYYDDMPHVLRQSKINLNITLRSIRSGIPLRCMDILGCGGFLLSNYQEDFLRHFVEGEDLVLYDSTTDLINKCEYYLEHEDKRKSIAKSGYEKVKENHNYEKVLNAMFSNLS